MAEFASYERPGVCGENRLGVPGGCAEANPFIDKLVSWGFVLTWGGATLSGRTGALPCGREVPDGKAKSAHSGKVSPKPGGFPDGKPRAAHSGKVSPKPGGFPKGENVKISGNVAAILQASRYGRFFTIHGDRSHHLGLLGENS